ncbi:MAG: alkaline phosphatase PhoX [Pyrinomonadaceae bacterium]
MDRRSFIFTAGMAGTGAFAFSGLANRANLLSGNHLAPFSTLGYGPLFPTKSNNTGETILAVPKGFQYTVIGKAGSIMTDGRPTPGAHDGMAAFRVGNQLRLVRNHEINNQTGKPGIAIGPNAYDPLAAGGTTTLVIDPETREVVNDFVSLSGTLVNCAGGPTPWNSWISCEETLLGPAKFKDADGQDQGGFGERHGYCFEVPASSEQSVRPVPLKDMGCFQHEAIAVDPKTGIVYLTEDRPAAGFYRFIPRKKRQLAAGGRLQMLAVKQRPNFDTRTQQNAGIRLPVSWVDIANPDPPEAERDDLAVYKQGFAAGAATFARLEGCAYGKGRIFFDSTSGGDTKLGQVWEYAPKGEDQGVLTMLCQPTDPAVLNMPDNLCLTSKGSVIICEDNSTSNHLRVMSGKGKLGTLAKNVMEGFENREFAGVTFSPDFKTLFVNIQVPGVTLAIWGPWQSI